MSNGTGSGSILKRLNGHKKTIGAHGVSAGAGSLATFLVVFQVMGPQITEAKDSTKAVDAKVELLDEKVDTALIAQAKAMGNLSGDIRVLSALFAAYAEARGVTLPVVVPDTADSN